MNIFERNQQTLTKHSHSYVAEEFVWLQPKRAFTKLGVIGGEA